MTQKINPDQIALTSAHILIGNASNASADVAMSGDASIANTGAVTVAKVNGNTPGVSAVAHKFVTAIDTSARGTLAQPDWADLTSVPSTFTPSAHNVLSTSHGDTTTASVVRGDLITGQGASPSWSRLAISVPAANVRNVLGIDNGETEPSWKTALDATAPTTIAAGASASAGTSLVFAHRDHTHGAPSTYPATAHNVFDSTYHSDVLTTSPLVRGSIAYVNATPKLATLAKGAAGTYPTWDANDLVVSKLTLTQPATSATLTIADNTTVSITGGGTLALGSYTLTVPASLTAAGVDIPNNFTANNTFDTNTLFIDAANHRVGIKTLTPDCDVNVVTQSSNQPRGIAIDNYANSTSAGSLLLRKARGTPASPSAILSGDGLGAVCFQGHDGTYFGSSTLHAGLIQCLASENWALHKNGNAMVFSTTPTGTDSLTEYLRISPEGYIGLSNSNPSARLDIKPNSDSVIGLSIHKNSVTASGNLFQIVDSDASIPIKINSALQLSVDTIATITSGTALGMFLRTDATPASDSSANYYGIQLSSKATGLNYNLTGAMYGASFSVFPSPATGKTVAKTVAATAGINQFGAGTITTAIGIEILSLINDGAGTITNNYGLYIQNQSLGATNYAIYSAGGQSYHAGNLGIAIVPTTALHIYKSAESSFTGTAKGAIQIEGDDTNLYYRSITFGRNNGQVLGRIAIQRTGSGSYMLFGTSNQYSAGVTNSAITIDYLGNIGLANTAPTARLHIVGTADTQQFILKLNATQNTNAVELQNSSGTVQLAIAGNGRDFVLDTTTGTKWGTATSQKQAWWNATPIVQPTTAIAGATRVGNAGNAVTDADTFDGYTIPQIVKVIRNLGLAA